MIATIRPPYLLACLLALCLACPALHAQSTPEAATHLRRKCFMGVQPLPLSDSLRTVSGLKGGVLLGNVLPNGTMELLGAKPGDVITHFNGQAVNSWEEWRPMLPKTFEGDPLRVDLWRSVKGKGKVVHLAGTVKGAPREQSTARYDVQYGEAPFETGFLRTITMLPKTPGPHTIVYFIPGYNCFSIDNMPRNDAYPKLFDSLAALGHIVYRVEKPGMGDGPSPCKCLETGFDRELAAFEAGYRNLLAQPWAAEERIFIMGHSMGGVQAPLLTLQGQHHPRGIAVYGTVFQTWYEYILNMLRFQEPRTDESYLTFEQDMGEYIKLFYEHYVLFKPLSEIVQNDRWRALLERDFLMDQSGNLLFRKAEYWQEIARHTLTDAWAKTDAHVLSLYGEADFEVFNAFSMSEIAAIVNAYHPGHGSYQMLAGTDHGMIQFGSMEQAFAMRLSPEYRPYSTAHFNYGIVTAVHTWIERVMKAG